MDEVKAELQYPDKNVFLQCFKEGFLAAQRGGEPRCPYEWGSMGAGAWTAGLFVAKEGMN